MSNSHKCLLLIFHTPSKNTQLMLKTMVDAINKQALERVELVHLSPFDCQPDDVLKADAIVLGTTENLGYMSGALKDFFDRNYYPCLEAKRGTPVAAVIRAGHDGTGTCRALKTILTGLGWRWVQEPLICKGAWQDQFLEECRELATSVALALEEGMI